MQKPLCKLCATMHWSREPCSAVGEASLPKIDLAMPIRKITQAEALEMYPPSPSEPLSVADRSKRYRANKGDEYRKRNRERMKRKRKS